jgi:hypothetical protein
MTGLSRRLETRPLDAGYRFAPFPDAAARSRTSRAQTACRCHRPLAARSRRPAKSLFRSARRIGRPQRRQSPLLLGGLLSIGACVVSLQYGGARGRALPPSQRPLRRRAVGTLVTTTPLPAG